MQEVIYLLWKWFLSKVDFIDFVDLSTHSRCDKKTDIVCFDLFILLSLTSEVDRASIISTIIYIFVDALGCLLRSWRDLSYYNIM